MTDKELIDKIRNNDEQAFAEIIDKYKDACFRVAYGIVQDKHTADDVVQDVFVKFWQIRKDFELTSKFTTWMYRVATNMALNKVRKQKKSKVFSSLGFDNNDDNEFENKLVHNAEADKNDRNEYIKKALKTALDTLPKKQRIAFVLNKYEKMSYKEVAEVMELSLANVETLIHRAKKNLQKKLLDTYKNLKY